MDRREAGPGPVNRTVRIPLLALAGLSLLGALWAGLVRLGWALPALPVPVAGQHGPLMVSGFIGTLVSLERAVALGARGSRHRAAYLAPALSGLGAVALLLGLPTTPARGLIVLGALGLVLIFVVINRLQPDAAHAVMGGAALLWLAGNLLWIAGRPVAQAVPWWVGFLVLTIAGERLELARVLLLKRGPKVVFGLLIALFLVGLLISVVTMDAGLRIAGAGLLGLGVWLLRFDLARRTIRQSGLTRFIAACLLLGYVWLLVGGGLMLIFGGRYTAGPIYDATLHAVFLGFVISMIFGHAPVIFPAVLGVPIPYRPAFYAHLGLLHLSLVLRVVGDLSGLSGMRQWGGLLNEVAILLFLANTVRASLGRPKSA